MSNNQDGNDGNGQPSPGSMLFKKMVHPERFELPTFWFVVRFMVLSQNKPVCKVLKTLEGNWRNWYWFALNWNPIPA